jgi:hypothetical protein
MNLSSLNPPTATFLPCCLFVPPAGCGRRSPFVRYHVPRGALPALQVCLFVSLSSFAFDVCAVLFMQPLRSPFCTSSDLYSNLCSLAVLVTSNASVCACAFYCAMCAAYSGTRRPWLCPLLRWRKMKKSSSWGSKTAVLHTAVPTRSEWRSEETTLHGS